MFELYKDYSADQLEKAVAEIIHGYENEEPTFVSMKCGFQIQYITFSMATKI